MTYNQIAFALEILKLIAAKPRKREELSELLAEFLDKNDKNADDIPQKLTRTIRKLRDCGFNIKSAPHHPYELLESNFPVILSPQQRQALYMAAHFLANMGFSAPASQIIRIGKLSEADQPPNFKVDFSPPIDYSENQITTIVQKLQEQFERKCRYSIYYENSNGEAKFWDLDLSGLRLHNGVLYLFAFVPDADSRNIQKRPNVEQNFIFRVDRIKTFGGTTNIPWFWQEFPTLTIRYCMTGPLKTYQPRRQNERVIERNIEKEYVVIETTEEFIFWFSQRILQYGSNVQILEPEWLVQEIKQELIKAYQNYENNS
ncbi:helix-turn-helix transcriptional regulator [Gloeothece verrucosa]|uniref:Putative transcriptional regulator protein n=1 Tax=Gloeothece verrucosa (strain PCC 7822) TaxID=497965 RepID=E0UKM1_GLOV7|nr:WYL domain-containing protein [Gloeothece verrucosa]ADN17501.1 putative transcriptional regulator protein [Gloeothece verrucosa PCC 7822]